MKLIRARPQASHSLKKKLKFNRNHLKYLSLRPTKNTNVHRKWSAGNPWSCCSKLHSSFRAISHNWRLPLSNKSKRALCLTSFYMCKKAPPHVRTMSQVCTHNLNSKWGTANNNLNKSDGKLTTKWMCYAVSHKRDFQGTTVCIWDYFCNILRNSFWEVQ